MTTFVGSASPRRRLETPRCSWTQTGPIPSRRPSAWLKSFASEASVAWFEEPVSSDDLDGLAQVRGAAPAAMDIAAGEYAYNVDDIRRMLTRRAVDVQQADASRCLGITGFLQAAALCDAHHIDLSGHCAPALHLHPACAAPRLRHLEWFHDHVRIEHMLFDGAPVPKDGAISPDMSRPGTGSRLQGARRGALRRMTVGKTRSSCADRGNNAPSGEILTGLLLLGAATVVGAAARRDPRPPGPREAGRRR